MKFTKGKYKGYDFEEIEFMDPNYISWCRENAPYVLPSPPIKLDPSEEVDYIPAYKNLPFLSPEDAF